MTRTNKAQISCIVFLSFTLLILFNHRTSELFFKIDRKVNLNDLKIRDFYYIFQIPVYNCLVYEENRLTNDIPREFIVSNSYQENALINRRVPVCFEKVYYNTRVAQGLELLRHSASFYFENEKLENNNETSNKSYLINIIKLVQKQEFGKAQAKFDEWQLLLNP